MLLFVATWLQLIPQQEKPVAAKSCSQEEPDPRTERKQRRRLGLAAFGWVGYCCRPTLYS